MPLLLFSGVRSDPLPHVLADVDLNPMGDGIGNLLYSCLERLEGAVTSASVIKVGLQVYSAD